MQAIPDDLMPLAAAARLLGVHPRTLGRWCAAGLLRWWRIGRRKRVRQSDLAGLVSVSEPNGEAVAREEEAARAEFTDRTLREEGVRR